MSLTRKHYVMLAEALREAEPTLPPGWTGKAAKVTGLDIRWQGWEDALRAIADVLAADNKAFDRQRFIKAAQGDKE